MSSYPDDEEALPPALVAAWRADRPAPMELRRGYARFLRERGSRRRGVGMLVWIALGMLLGVGLAQAATSRGWSSWFGKQSAALPVAHPATSSTPRAESSLPPPPPSAPSSIVSAAPPLRTSITPKPSERTPSSLPEQWQRAARGLRERDFPSANQALLEIERSAPAGERDAARLARAQLLLGHGRTAEGTTLLRDLEQRGASEQVRSKARALLARPSENIATDRSNEPGAVTQ